MHGVQVLGSLAQLDLVDNEYRVVENQLIDAQPATLMEQLLGSIPYISNSKTLLPTIPFKKSDVACSKDGII